MKPLCGRTIKGVITFVTFFVAQYIIVRLLWGLTRVIEDCNDGESLCTKRFWMIEGISVGGALFLYIAFKLIRRRLILCFPVACGHRRCIFTGRSSKPLHDILLGIDKQIPSEGELQEYRDKSLLYLDDIKAQFESAMTTRTFQFIFSGSGIERHGVPLMMSYKPKCCLCNALCSIHALHTDLDVMFCSLEDRASFSGQGNILVEPFLNKRGSFTGYATLFSLKPGYEGYRVSSKVIRDQAKRAVENTSVANLPGVPCCCGRCELPRKIKLVSKGPAMKINIGPLFEADITLCFHCPEWPTISDWPSRQRYWPSLADAQRIMSLGCHLVAKPAPDDEDKSSWRFSFSVAEVELSKLVPETARKCFLAMKIILKDHLQPVVPEIGSYHIKTIFLNSLEKFPVGFWVEENIEECLLTLLTELRDSFVSMKCSHHWFSFVNLFDINGKKLQILARKIERIMKDPAP
ncbi:PREDICTED: uncharacterized protein LOC107355595, partial [Acropora digitifera]|uniref:uncharacterized protein LOC107355595 n=1 Tax=Acropora digitifera TaxID=70779 RepID=UPI00077AF356